MKKFSTIAMILAFAVSFTAAAQEPTALGVLKKVDSVVNAPRDQELKAKLILIDKDGNEKEREIVMIQKGSEKRMIRFLSPASQRGIAFLNLPGDLMYIYLPAFKKVRRIAAHVKNQKFAGTDFSYDDLGTLDYTVEYDPEIVEKTEKYFVLELKPKKGIKKEYSRLRMWVRRDNFYTEKAEYYDDSDRVRKILEWRRIERIGDYWVSREFEAYDLRDDHRTKIILLDVKFDSGLKDDLFTTRYLKRER